MAYLLPSGVRNWVSIYQNNASGPDMRAQVASHISMTSLLKHRDAHPKKNAVKLRVLTHFNIVKRSHGHHIFSKHNPNEKQILGIEN